MAQKVNSLGKSRFTLAVLGGFLIGIFFADKIPLGFSWAIGIIIGLVISIIILWKDRLIFNLSLFSVLAFILGLTYYHYWDYRESIKILQYNQQVNIESQIISKPEITNTQKFVIKHQNTKILIQTGKYPEYHYGDILKISGKLEKPYPENYYFKKGIRGQIRNPDKIEVVGNRGNIIVKGIYKVGDKFEESLNQILSEPYAALQAGIILGVKRNIPDSLMSDFNRTGTTHIIAVSGYNVTIIIMFLSYFLMRFSRKISFFGSILGIVIFVILTGAVASVLRAGILLTLVLFAKFIGRRPYYPILILLVATVMILFNPYALKNDISFQLSFLAFSGLIWLSPKIEQIRFIKSFPDLIKKAFSETMGAQIGVLPILLFNFGILSIVAPLANILILPTIPASMLLGFLGGLAGIVWIEIGKLIGIIAWIILKYIIVVVEVLSKIPAAAVTLKTSDWWWIPIYYLLVMILFRLQFSLLGQPSNNQKNREQEEI
ncbi:hypothetical protein A2V71_01095 [Candidatus Berkelbacteria bacterium RBG_13_40_8]|uniref:Uncharacterized protein n=1 Tax=Candidatus Berkelbacteria bacterium RBG_13_40_8 TaxID=1797467 RepID=A0A1F5DPB2_9BACT|nr:MAG: hypothetical protein A2V71_01095 [Candidatus Berkelbacteria bacterium RBG_13_40_8]